LLLFLEKEESYLVEKEEIGFLGARPQTPRVGFAEVWVGHNLLQSRTNAFCFFFWKKKNCIILDILDLNITEVDRMGCMIDSELRRCH
jgi:hypothetical protein